MNKSQKWAVIVLCYYIVTVAGILLGQRAALNHRQLALKLKLEKEKTRENSLLELDSYLFKETASF